MGLTLEKGHLISCQTKKNKYSDFGRSIKTRQGKTIQTIIGKTKLLAEELS